MEDNRFWELVDDFENGKVTAEEVLDIVCRSTKNYTVATADFVTIVQRPMTKEEKEKIKEKIYAKNNRRNTQINSGKDKKCRN